MINKWIHKRDTQKKDKVFYEKKNWVRGIADNLSPLIFIYHPPLDAVGYLMMVSATSEKMCIISILMSNIAILPDSTYHYNYFQKLVEVGFVMLKFSHFVELITFIFEINSIRVAPRVVEATTQIKCNSWKHNYSL